MARVRSPGRARPGRARTRRASIGRALLVALPLLVLGAWALERALLADPEPRMRARRGTLEQVTQQWERVDRERARRTLGLRLASSSGLAVELALVLPLAPPEEPRPLVLLLGGHRTGREAVELVHDTGGALIAALSYPYEGDPKAKGLAVLAAAPAIRRALLDTPPAVQLALDWLCTRPEVDPRRIELVGVSLGAPFAVIAGALDERVARVWSIHGAGDPRALLEHNLAERVPSAFLRALVVRLAEAAGCLPRLAPERWAARIAPRPLVLLNAEEDEKMPRACVEALWRATRAPAELAWLPGGHVRPKKEQLVRELVARVLARLEPPS